MILNSNKKKHNKNLHRKTSKSKNTFYAQQKKMSFEIFV